MIDAISIRCWLRARAHAPSAGAPRGQGRGGPAGRCCLSLSISSSSGSARGSSVRESLKHMMPPQDRCVRIFACVALVAAVQLAVSNATSSVLAPHPMRSAAGAPGLYANYDWPKSSPSSPDMEVDHVWTTIPSGSDSNGNGVFASSQYWYESYGQACPNRSDHGMSCNSAGYMGSQV
eukprot:SAG31_NODE_3021_length_4780_cov_10.795770_4_plen_178_part_00